jgi:hypothetical protein
MLKKLFNSTNPVMPDLLKALGLKNCDVDVIHDPDSINAPMIRLSFRMSAYIMIPEAMIEDSDKLCKWIKPEVKKALKRIKERVK